MKALSEVRTCTRHRNTSEVVAVGMASLLVLVFASYTCLGTWSDLPDNIHAVMPILHNEATDSAAASVFLMKSSQLSFQNLYRNSHWSNDEIASYWERISATCTQKWGSTCNVLYLMVVPTIGCEGEAAWWPWNLIMTQDQRSYTISLSNSIVGLSRAFHGRVYSTMDGLILLPEGIDASRPFQINYWATEITIGPF